MNRHVSIVMHGLVGWAICGATIGIGRQFLSTTATLVIHALVAPAAFSLLTWDHVRRSPGMSPMAVGLWMVGLVVGLDALVVAPFMERSYEMFRSIAGTWLPFGSIFVASYLAARIVGK